MPTVPVPQYQRQSQTQVAAPNVARFQQQPTLADGLAEVGQNLSGVIQQQKHKTDLAFAQNALLDFNKQADDLINNPQTGLITKQGAQAMGQSQAISGQLSDLAQKTYAAIPDGDVKQQFWGQFQQAGQQVSTRAKTYEVGQRQQFEAGQFQGLITNLQQQAENSFDDNDAFVAANLQAKDQIVAYGQTHGQSPEEIEANWTNFRDKSSQAALTAQLTAGRYDQFLQKNGEPSDLTGVTRFTAHGNSSSARGVRNNNPGNIEASDQNPWEGQTGSDGRFATFETPEHGIRALGKNLLSYNRQGIDTVSEVVNRWAPAADGNNTDAYIKALCKSVGVGPNDPLDMSNPNTLAALCAGIVTHENGNQPYSEDQINSGVNAALGLSALTSSKRRTGNAAFDTASPVAQGQFLRQAQAMQKEQQAQYRVQFETTAKDAEASYLRGVDYPMPELSNFVAAYGYRQGQQKYQELDDQRKAGQYIGAFKTMPTASITAAVQTLKPAAGDGFASRASAYDHVNAAATAVLNKRKNDPYGAAVDLGMYKPLSTSSAADVSTEIQSRYSNNANLKNLGINAPILSQQEATGLTQLLKGSPDVDQSISTLQTMGRTLPPGALRQVAGAVAPNSAAMAYSALLLSPADNQYDNRQPVIPYSNFVAYKPTMDKYDAAKTILQGDQLINPTAEMKKAGISEVKLPSDDKLTQKFNEQVGNSFAHNPQARQMAFGVFKSAYAGIVYRSGDVGDTSTTSVNSDAAEKAAAMATGGVYKGFQGGDVVMPFGMDKSTFKDRYTEAAQSALKDAGLNPAGQANFTPVNVGSGQYRLVSGSGRWAVDPRSGKEITVTVRAN
ncbi:hypothetical protein LLS47_12315 [Rouxiella badensis]|uniref:hypothetical protein n=1 Tax=Rouxiella badensis TaxID=1646377 RepID=UPI001D15BBF5|nr:hypothetical protein [Rouxiella badensis]MCC3733712.1 hypothetical protein [Rouxiella badensis]MCC3759635.1 hypothetical protein [Rouxiella badensis]